MQGAYFAQIPTLVLLHPDLKCFEKLLYADIMSLTCTRGYCWASNGYLAARHGCSIRAIQKAIGNLVRHGLLFVIDRFSGKKGERKIFTESTFIQYATENGLDISKYINKNYNGGENGGSPAGDSGMSPFGDDELPKPMPSGRQGRSGKETKGVNKCSRVGVNKCSPNSNISNDAHKSDLLRKSYERRNAVHRERLKPKLNSTKKTKSITSLTQLSPHTIDILTYWNAFATLTTHRLKYDEDNKPLPVEQQSKTVATIDKTIKAVLSGKFYKLHKDVHVGARNGKYTVAQIKLAIKRLATACSPDYTHTKFRTSLALFFFNKQNSLSDVKGEKYKYKYPFLHYMSNEPKPLSEKPTRVKTENSGIVTAVIKRLGFTRITDRQYNTIAKSIDKAVAMVRKNANGSTSLALLELPDVLKELMENKGIDMHPNSIGLGVYHLQSEMKRRGYF